MPNFPRVAIKIVHQEILRFFNEVGGRKLQKEQPICMKRN